MESKINALFDEKILIINGKPNSGKSILASIIANTATDKICLIDGKRILKENFPFNKVNTDTQIIIIDDLPKDFDFYKLIFMNSEKSFPVNKIGQNLFFLCDFKIIAITSENIDFDKLGASFTRRVKIITIN